MRRLRRPLGDSLDRKRDPPRDDQERRRGKQRRKNSGQQPEHSLGKLARGCLAIGSSRCVAGREVHVAVPFVAGRNLHADGLRQQHRQQGRRESHQRRSSQYAPTDAG